MAYLNSDNYLAWVGGVSGAAVAGQTGMTFNRSRGAVDRTTKADDYTMQRPGIASIDLSIDGLISLPDANGYTALETAWKAKTAVTIQIRKDGAAGDGTTDVVFEASMYVTSINTPFGQRTDAPYSIAFMLAAAPTVDTMAV